MPSVRPRGGGSRISEFASIVICAHNHLSDLSIPCLNHVLKGTSYPYELILVDDGSKDATIRYFATLTDKAFHLSRRRGPSKAKNVGLQNAEGDLIITLDNDVLVPAGWLTTLVQGSKKPHVGIVAGIPSNERDRLRAKPSADGLIDFPSVSGACMGITRQCFNAVGFFDEALVNAEDRDYCHRALLAGFRVSSAPRLVVPHLSGPTRREVDKENMERSAWRFRRKYIEHQDRLPVPPLYPFG